MTNRVQQGDADRVSSHLWPFLEDVHLRQCQTDLEQTRTADGQLLTTIRVWGNPSRPAVPRRRPRPAQVQVAAPTAVDVPQPAIAPAGLFSWVSTAPATAIWPFTTRPVGIGQYGVLGANGDACVPCSCALVDLVVHTMLKTKASLDDTLQRCLCEIQPVVTRACRVNQQHTLRRRDTPTAYQQLPDALAGLSAYT